MTELSPRQILDAVERGLDLAGTAFVGPSKEILIVGTGHETYQIRPREAPSDNVEAFEAKVVQFVQQRHPDAVAEEMSLEALAGRMTVGQEVTEAHGLDHMLCDPTSTEREALGIANDNSPTSWQKREAEWARRLSRMSARRILFVCGANHVASFAKLCRDLGWKVEVLCWDFHANNVPLERRII